MAQTPINPAPTPAFTLQPAGVTPPTLDKAFVASDPVNGNSYLQSSGGDLIIVWNTDVAAQTFGIKSVADQFGRFADVSYTVQPGNFAAVRVTPQSIYTQATGLVLLSSSSANVKFLVLQGA